MIYYVYTYTDPLNEEVFYVGFGKNRRMTDHIRNAKNGTHKNTHFANRIIHILSQGLKPITNKIAEGLEKDDAKQLEIEMIARLGRRDLGTGTLTNWTDGGDGTRGWSNEQRAVQSNRRGGKINAIDSSGARFLVSQDDPRWVSGELKGQNSGIRIEDTTQHAGRFQVRDASGIYYRITKDDPRWISGELFGVNTGASMPDAQKLKISKSQVGIPRPKPPGFREKMKEVARLREQQKREQTNL